MKRILIATGAAAGMLTLFLALFSSAANADLDDANALEIMKKSGCIVCHSIDKKVVGPAYKDVAQKRKDESDAAAKLKKAVRSGSKGVYGQMPMPPNPPSKISDADLHELMEWVLTRLAPR